MRHTKKMAKTELSQFDQIVEKYQRDIINFHYRLVGNRFEAEDLAQETFIKAYKNFKRLKEPEKVKSWLFSIARNTTMDFFRKNKNKDILMENEMLQNLGKEPSVGYDTHLINSEISRELEKCINMLVAQDKAIIKLLYYDGFSYKEICEFLKINENTLKSRLHRARKVLFEIIQADASLKDVLTNHG